MKNLKLNEQKIKKVLRNGIVLSIAAFSIVNFSGCDKKQVVPSDYPSGFEYIDQQSNEFDKCSNAIIREGNVVNAYKRDEIVITIDKETFEVKEYILHETNKSTQVYDLKTGYLVIEVSLPELIHPTPNTKNTERMFNNVYDVNFNDLNAYLEDETLKDYYTAEEIIELEPKIVESVKLILEAEKEQQITKVPNRK